MKKIFLHRLEKLDDRTLGRLLIFDGLNLVGQFTTLELPFRNNQRNVSSILSGFYHLTPRHSPKYGNHLLVEGVLNRDLILIHQGNYPKDTEGCILIGRDFGHLNKDGFLEVTGSRHALAALVKMVPEKTEFFVL